VLGSAPLHPTYNSDHSYLADNKSQIYHSFMASSEVLWTKQPSTLALGVWWLIEGVDIKL